MSESRDRVHRFQVELLDWARENQRWFPWRGETASLYDVFVAEFLLSRTRSETVATVYDDFLAQYPSVEALDSASEEEVASVIRPCGMQNRRAAALTEIGERVDGELPTTVPGLLDLPQVGPYVAHATVCFALHAQVPIVDRNVDRVYRRVFPEIWPEDSSAEKWDTATELLPEGDARTYNLGLLDFASLICTAQSPNCESCFANPYCPSAGDFQSAES